jgi:hypothetical protein
MKKNIINIMIFSLILFFCLNATPAEKPTGPRILIEETSFDAKVVMQGKMIRHTFKVQNTGDQPLEINKVQPG